MSKYEPQPDTTFEALSLMKDIIDSILEEAPQLPKGPHNEAAYTITDTIINELSHLCDTGIEAVHSSEL